MFSCTIGVCLVEASAKPALSRREVNAVLYMVAEASFALVRFALVIVPSYLVDVNTMLSYLADIETVLVG
jgi:hypothetical protein